MSFSLVIFASLAVSNLVYTGISASSDSLNETSAQISGCPADAEESWSYRGSNASSDSLNETSAQISGCPADAEESWSYRGSNGPAYWGQRYPQCYGARQSPIAVDSSRVLMDDNLDKLRLILYDHPITNMTIVNDGKTIKVIPDFPPGRIILVNYTFYGLYEIQFHWGSTMRRGSEHIIDGRQYAMEMHLVHRRFDDKYVVVAVFFEQGAGINAELQHIVNELPKVMYKNTSVVSRWRIDLMNLLPELHMTSFYYYNGSLTVPDCSENVSWILLKTPVFIGNTQIREFRKLFSAIREEADCGCRITGNIRPVQHLHGRQVFSSK